MYAVPAVPLYLLYRCTAVPAVPPGLRRKARFEAFSMDLGQILGRSREIAISEMQPRGHVPMKVDDARQVQMIGGQCGGI